MPEPIPEPARAEEVLAAVAAAPNPSGSAVTLAMIAEVGCVKKPMAGRIRRWARSSVRRDDGDA